MCSISAHSSGVLSVCCLQSGSTTNVIPDDAVLKGTIRDFHPDVGATLLRRLREVVSGTASAFGVSADVSVSDSYPSIVNAAEPTGFVTELCVSLFGKEGVLGDLAPDPGAEVLSLGMLRTVLVL